MHREGPTEKLRRSASIPFGRVEGCLNHGSQTRIGVCGLSVRYDMAELQQDRWHSQELSHEVPQRQTCDNFQRFYRCRNHARRDLLLHIRYSSGMPSRTMIGVIVFKLAETDTCCAL